MKAASKSLAFELEALFEFERSILTTRGQNKRRETPRVPTLQSIMISNAENCLMRVRHGWGEQLHLAVSGHSVLKKTGIEFLTRRGREVEHGIVRNGLFCNFINSKVTLQHQKRTFSFS